MDGKRGVCEGELDYGDSGYLRRGRKLCESIIGSSRMCAIDTCYILLPLFESSLRCRSIVAGRSLKHRKLLDPLVCVMCLHPFICLGNFL